MTWFVDFLNEAADQWFAEADTQDLLASQALARGDLFTHAHAQGEATAYRRMARTFHRHTESVATGPLRDDDPDVDLTPADFDQLTEVAA